MLSYLSLISVILARVTIFAASTSMILSYLIGYLISKSSLLMSLTSICTHILYKIYFFLSNIFILYILNTAMVIYAKSCTLLVIYILIRIFCSLLIRSFDYICHNLFFKNHGIIFLQDIEVTATKLLVYFSNQKITYRQLLNEYSKFLLEKKQMNLTFFF
ncbi:hypothetical protein Csac_2213 [Caldicellulosiruptor saccharolyticus DSM 8903]|uniref:Transmembrane protein n=1 Tax=Caldicellulosiruptor saccharolyticus (strain ATCC 43494 / DSM 8903 / Tp8T 6331) TaxID=351627 RepID=A4XLK7_CALS8|nr:hypothetical protein Csac_2213 [Caldicellulosiruptor saccharolyticus DSM 8903]